VPRVALYDDLDGSLRIALEFTQGELDDLLRFARVGERHLGTSVTSDDLLLNVRGASKAYAYGVRPSAADVEAVFGTPISPDYASEGAR